MIKRQLRVSLVLSAAFLCLIAGVLLDRAVLERVVVPDGGIESQGFRILLFLVQLACVGVSVWLYRKRQNPESLEPSVAIVIAACSFAGGIAGMEILLPNTEEVSGWRSFSAQSEQNELRFRGQPIQYSPEDFVVVLLGDSQVESKASAYQWMPERRLQHYLNLKGMRAKVFTVGASGYGQDQELLALKEYLAQFRADLVLVWLTPGNDIVDTLWPTFYRGGNKYPKPTFWLEDGKLAGPTEQIGESVALSRFEVLSRIRRLGWDRDLSFVDRYPPPYTPRDQYDGPITRRTYPYGMSGAYGEVNLRIDRSGLTPYLTPRSPRITYALDLMRVLISEIKRTVSHQGGQVALFTAGPMAEGAEIVQGHEVIEVAGKYYEISSEQFLSNLAYITSGFNYDHIPITLADWAVGPDDGHLNEHAGDEAMASLAEKIAPLLSARGR